MEQAKSGDTVKVHYKGKLNDGTVFANSSKREPFEFVIGGEQIIPGFEEAVVGMNPGESKTITVLADSAFGPYHEELVRTIERNKFPEGLAPEVGQRLNLNESDGREIVVTVTDSSESSVTLDANHPLAGEDLIFDIELIEIA